MTPADAQQQRLLDRLRETGDQPVAFVELHAGGIAFPATMGWSAAPVAVCNTSRDHRG